MEASIKELAFLHLAIDSVVISVWFTFLDPVYIAFVAAISCKFHLCV